MIQAHYTTMAAQLQDIPDPRSRRGQRYEWPYLLMIAAGAVMAGQQSVRGMAQWATAQAATLLACLQPHRGQIPSVATLRVDDTKAHGRLERRTLESTPALNEYLEWPGVAQVLRRTCQRTEIKTGKTTTHVRLAVTSLPRHLVSLAQIELLWRRHWTDRATGAKRH